MSRLLRVVLLAVVGAVLLSGCDFSVYSLPLPGGAKLGDNPYTVKVEFRDVLDLVPQASVKVDDVSVGKVKSVKVVGQHAEVTVELRRSVRLPDNAIATIRQTSLLGEKFVSLAPPTSGATGRLSNGDVIPLSRSGRNPEVEEVLGALSLLLNGGGVAQLKTISSELNKALGGRETDVKQVLSRLDVLMGQLDSHKDEIVAALRSLDRLAISLNKQKPAITSALDNLPRAISSINRQRDDLVRMLQALSHLSKIGTQVILQSKTATVDSLKALAPTLTKLAETGQDFPKALQVFLTYPFVDAVVGTNPAQARNLHMGDYTNLSIQLNLDLSDLGISQVCATVPQLKDLPVNICNNPKLEACAKQLLNVDPNKLPSSLQGLLDTVLTKCAGGVLATVCSSAQLPAQLTSVCNLLSNLPLKLPKLPVKVPSLSKLTKCLTSGKPLGSACDALNPLTLVQKCTATSKKNKPSGYYSATCTAYRKAHIGLNKNGNLIKLPVLGGGSGSGGSGGSGGGGGGGLLGLPGLGRTAVGRPAASSGVRRDPHASDLGAMLVWGMVSR